MSKNNTPRKSRDARQGKLSKDRASGLVDGLAALVRAEYEAGHIGDKLGLEGPLRHALRGDLCLQGWRWNDANAAAKNLTDIVQLRVGATRPSWNEGQPEWTIKAGALIERTFCAHCRKPLPEGTHKFCSYLCGQAHHSKIKTRKASSEAQATREVVQMI